VAKRRGVSPSEAIDATPYSAMAAGDDELEPGEVRRDVEREPVHRDPARDTHADRAELAMSAPERSPGQHEGEARSTHEPIFAIRRPRLDAERERGGPSMTASDRSRTWHVAASGLRSRWDKHQLPGPVVGHVAAATRLHQVDSADCEVVLREQHVGELRRASEREPRVVLGQQQGIEIRPWWRASASVCMNA